MSDANQKSNLFDRTVWAVGLLGFASGLPLPLVFGTLSLWLKDAGLSNAAIGFFAAASVPYVFKWAWAPVLDLVRLGPLGAALGDRRAWIVLMQLGCAATIASLAFANPAAAPREVAMLVVLLATLSATQDIGIDAYRVSAVQVAQQGTANAAYVFGYRIGMLGSGAGALILADRYGWQQTFLTLALVMAGCVLITLFAPRVDLPKAAQDQPRIGGLWGALAGIFEPLTSFFRTRGWLFILVFVALFKLGDAVAGTMTNPFLVEVGFSKTELATVSKLFAFAALIPGAFVGGWMMRRYGVEMMLWVGGILQAGSNLLFVYQARAGHDVQALYLTMGGENFATGFGTTVFVAYLSSLCSVRFSATQYALLSALAAVGRTVVSSFSGVWATSWGWETFFLSTAFMGLPALLLLPILKQQNAIRESR
jgi:PAT family beta-lactamase induction signal transducer AmpG